MKMSWTKVSEIIVHVQEESESRGIFLCTFRVFAYYAFCCINFTCISHDFYF